jgi:hypothetical protein
VVEVSLRCGLGIAAGDVDATSMADKVGTFRLEDVQTKRELYEEACVSVVLSSEVSALFIVDLVVKQEERGQG